MTLAHPFATNPQQPTVIAQEEHVPVARNGFVRRPEEGTGTIHAPSQTLELSHCLPASVVGILHDATGAIPIFFHTPPFSSHAAFVFGMVNFTSVASERIVSSVFFDGLFCPYPASAKPTIHTQLTITKILFFDMLLYTFPSIFFGYNSPFVFSIRSPFLKSSNILALNPIFRSFPPSSATTR